MATPKDENSPLIPIIAGLAVLTVALLVGVFFWVGGDDEGPVESPSGKIASVESEVESPASPASLPDSADGRREAGSGEARERPNEAQENPAPPNFSDILSQPNQGEVSSALRDEMRSIAESSGTQTQKVAKFKTYLRAKNDAPTQDLAVRHLSKLVKDDQYNDYLADELLDPNQPEAVQAALVRDINGRTRQVMLPVMVEIVTLPEHPLKSYAQETLGRYLGDGYSADPENLRSAVNEFMSRRSGDL